MVLHFVGFKDERYWSAIKVFGRPDFVHRYWDWRCVADIDDGDMVVFADGDETMPVRRFAYNDSEFF